jgi:hypothetical protein
VKPLEHRTLMRYHDGELSKEEAARVAERLGSDPESVEVLADLDRLGGHVREAALERASHHDDLVDAIMSRIQNADPARPAQSAGSLPREGQVAPITAARRFGRSRSVPAVIALSVTIAAAAAVALRINQAEKAAEHAARPSPPAAQEVAALPAPRPSAAAEAAEGLAADAPSAAAIEIVDFGANAGTIFLVPEGEETTPVVWLDDTAPSLGRMEPL